MDPDRGPQDFGGPGPVRVHSSHRPFNGPGRWVAKGSCGSILARIVGIGGSVLRMGGGGVKRCRSGERGRAPKVLP